MQVADLKIEGFRGIQSGHLRFGKHAMFVGPNNCGKTTIIEALTLLFGRDRLIKELTEHDFFGGNPQPQDRIRLIATIIGFDGDDIGQHPEWFRDDRGIPKWWNPSDGQLHATRDNQEWKLACQIAFAARFDRPSLEVETARYFHDDDVITDIFIDTLRTPVPTKLIRELGFFLVPASRTWDKIVSFDSELFRRVVDGVPAESVLSERDRLRTPTAPLEEDNNLQPILLELNRELAGFFISTPTVKLRLTSTDSHGVLESVIPHYAHANGPILPARRHGTGLVSLQRLLLLLQFGRRRATNGEGFWMALEEPELHVPPALQRRLVHRIQALSTQTFISTHSPSVAAMSDPEALVIIRNNEGALTSLPLQSVPLPNTTTNAVRKLFQLNRVDTITALMHDVVLIPEGRTDYDWIRLLLRIVDACQGWTVNEESFFSSHVGLVPTHDAAVVESYNSLSSLHPKVTCLVDGDADGLGYAGQLTALATPPEVVLRWPDNWMIEDIVGWIIQPDFETIVGILGDSIQPVPTSIEDLVSRLKSTDRVNGGLKQDFLSYETISEAISQSLLCCQRARELLNSLTDVLLGKENPRFTSEPTGNNLVKVFRP